MSRPSAPPKFGSAAVSLGYVNAEQVQQALDEQQRRRSSGTAAPLPIGLLLQEKGLLSPQQIAAVLAQLASGAAPISEDGVRLAARLKVLHAAAGNVIGVTGTVATDVARTVSELAVGLAVMEQGQVLAVDANLREPALHSLFDVPAAPGLIDHVAAGDQPPAPFPTRVAALQVVPAGQVDDRSPARCMSPEAANVINAWRERFRYTLVNLGPITRAPEAAVTASRCDGVLVVLRGGVSQKGELLDMQRLLAGLNVGLSGVVLVRPTSRAEARARRRA